ncbi:MAG: hypothetical protein WA624_01495 [Methylocella sp.]
MSRQEINDTRLAHSRLSGECQFKGWTFFAAAQLVFTVIVKLADNAVLTWADGQIASYLGLSTPQASTVISWIVPAIVVFVSLAIVVFVSLLIYHFVPWRISIKKSSVCAWHLSAEEDRFRQDLRKFVRSNVAEINESFGYLIGNLNRGVSNNIEKILQGQE